MLIFITMEKIKKTYEEINIDHHFLKLRADSFEETLMLGKIEGRRRGDDRG